MNNFVIMKSFIKNARIGKKLKIREVAELMKIDQALVSKFESGKRLPTESQVIDLARVLEIDLRQLLALWLKQKVLGEVSKYEFASESLSMVQEELQSYLPKKILLPNSIEQKINKLDELKNGLDLKRKLDNHRIVEALEMEYTFESNRIEGNTLSLKETDLIINEGLTVSGKSMREHLEAINHNEAIDYVRHLVEKKTLIDKRALLSIHNLILRGIHSDYAGKYRNVPVAIKGSKHIPPQPFVLESLMENYFQWYLNNKDYLHPVVLAAEMHERLVTIHPFIDGNGRTARLVMNAILLQNGFVIANIKGDYKTRMEYYDALEEVQIGGSKEKFVEFIVNVELDCLDRYLSILC